MKFKIVLVMIIYAIFLSGPAQAGDTKKVTDAKKEELCNVIGQVAGQVMILRQKQIHASRAMKIAGDDKMMQMIVIEAYEQPVYRVKENQKRLIREYENKWYIECIKSIEQKRE